MREALEKAGVRHTIDFLDVLPDAVHGYAPAGPALPPRGQRAALGAGPRAPAPQPRLIAVSARTEPRRRRGPTAPAGERRQVGHRRQRRRGDDLDDRRRSGRTQAVRREHVVDQLAAAPVDARLPRPGSDGSNGARFHIRQPSPPVGRSEPGPGTEVDLRAARSLDDLGGGGRRLVVEVAAETRPRSSGPCPRRHRRSSPGPVRTSSSTSRQVIASAARRARA